MMLQIHLWAAVWALLIGGFLLARPKGTPVHKALGASWMLAMIITAASSFWIESFIAVLAHLGPIHLLSIWILVAVPLAFLAILQGRVGDHRSYLIGSYLGLLGAGLGTLAPGRMIHGWVFGA